MRGATVWGLGTMVLGAVFLADGFGVFDVPPAGRWWPALFVLAGLSAAVRPEFRAFGAVVALPGLLALLHTTGVVPFARSWPVLLLAGGAALVFAGSRRSGSEKTLGAP